MFIIKQLFIIFSFTFYFACSAQDTIYTYTGVLKNVKIRDNQPTFVEYRPAYDEEKENIFLQKKDILAIVGKRGFYEIIVHDTPDSFHSTYFFIDSAGDTLRLNPAYEPSGVYATDSTIKLRRFKNDNDYSRYYGSRPHFYVNDSALQFYSSKQATFIGIDFSCMKLVNDNELPKGKLIKERYLSRLAERVNSNKLYDPIFLEGKKVISAIEQMQNSYSNLDSVSWVTAQNYTLAAGKIPAYIRHCNYKQTSGTGLTFIIEKFAKETHRITGYWVAFDFATRQTLLIDYIQFSAVGSQSSGYGWANYWEQGLLEAGVYAPLSFQKYLQLQKKGQLQLTD